MGWVSGLAAGVSAALLCTAIGLIASRWLAQADLVMIYMAGVVLVAMRLPTGPALLAAGISALAFDFVFIPPRQPIGLPSLWSAIIFAVMVLTASSVANVNQRLRSEEGRASFRERMTSALYRLSRDLSGAQTSQQVCALAIRDLSEIFSADVTVILARGEELRLESHDSTPAARAAEECWRTLVPVEELVPGGESAIWVPLIATHRPLGVVGARFSAERTPSDVLMRATLERSAQVIATALERGELLEAARKAELRAEVEQLRNSLLSAVSHDIRTPLASIAAAAAVLADPRKDVERTLRCELASTIVDEAERLTRLAQNLLELARLRTGQVALKSEAVAVDELVEVALRRLSRVLAQRPIEVDIPDEVPLLRIDRLLIEQVLVNLLENAAKYSPEGSPLEVRAVFDTASVTLVIADRGPGIAQGDEHRVFERFERGAQAGHADGGLGLGLAIARTIVESHGGLITLANRPEGGALAGIRLPRVPEEATPSRLETLRELTSVGHG